MVSKLTTTDCLPWYVSRLTMFGHSVNNLNILGTFWRKCYQPQVKHTFKILDFGVSGIDSCCPVDTTGRHWSGLRWDQVMCCFLALHHYLNQCLLIIRMVCWHVPFIGRYFTGNAPNIYDWHGFKIDKWRLQPQLSCQWVQPYQVECVGWYHYKLPPQSLSLTKITFNPSRDK